MVRRWHLVHYLATVGAALLALQLYVWIAWLADGPHQITRFRDHSHVSWTVARVFEVGILAAFIFCVIYAVRSSRRLGGLSFDAKLFIAGFSVIWLDLWTNFAAPIWMYSTQWLNLNNPLGYLPGVVNPDLKRLPLPAFHFLNYPVALLAAGVLVSIAMRRIKDRWPQLSTAQLVGLVAILGMAFDVAYEMPMFRFRLWAFPGSPNWLALLPGTSAKFPIFEIIPAGLAFATFGALRYFKDDAGREITERGLDHLPSRWRGLVSVLALVGLVQLVWIGCTSIQVVGGFYAAPYKPLPAFLVNDACDAPLSGGGHLLGTRYGPCPHEGGKYPIRHLGPAAAKPCVAGRPVSAKPVPWPPCPDR